MKWGIGRDWTLAHVLHCKREHIPRNMTRPLDRVRRNRQRPRFSIPAPAGADARVYIDERSVVPA